MNPNVRGRMANGCAYKSRLGILGIQAVKAGYAAFMTFVSGLERDWGQVGDTAHWRESTALLPKFGYVRIADMMLFFFAGAESADHGSQVLGGMSDERANANWNGFNARICLAVDNEFNLLMTQNATTLREVYIFGHSFGGACAECMADVFSGLFATLAFYAETYGAPRSVHCGVSRTRANHASCRNINDRDVVSHIPYHSDEAPLASRFLLATVRNAFNASGHPGQCRWFNADGTFSPNQDNNVMQVSDTTLSMLLWVTYANHITDRAHELATYVALMNAYAVRDPMGTLPPETVTSIPASNIPTGPPNNTSNVMGTVPTPANIMQSMELEEEQAFDVFKRAAFRSSAVPISSGGIHGAGFDGQVNVATSSRRRAKHLAKILNRVRRILGPLTTDQRADVIAAVEQQLLMLE